MPVPIAIIVCEGDIDTIAHTAGALQNKLPVVIIKGSGKAADLILNYIERYTLLIKLMFNHLTDINKRNGKNLNKISLKIHKYFF